MKLKKLISGCLTVALALTFTVSTQVKAAENLPEVAFVGVDHSPLVVGDKETFYLTSKGTGLVQYRVFQNKLGTDDWNEITSGYSKATDAAVPYAVSVPQAYELGGYKLSVWVKAAGTEGKYSNSNGGYDSIYIANLNCVEKDNNNRVYADGDLDIAKDVYNVGEKVTINGIKNIRGMKAPYKYKLHLFEPAKASASNSGWTNNVVNYSDKIEWTPTEAGTYVLDVWATSSDSKAAYESWKLKTITVVNGQGKDVKGVAVSKDGETYGGTDAASIKTVNDDVTVTGNNTTLQYLDIKGTLTINPGADGVVNLNNVKAKDIKVLSGATNSIHFKDVTADNLTVSSDSNVRIETTGTTKIGNTTVTSYAILDEKGGTLGTVTVTKGEAGTEPVVELRGTFTEKIVVESAATIKAAADAFVPKVEIAPASESSKVTLSGAFNAVDVTKAAKVELAENSSVRDTLKIAASAEVKGADTAKVGKIEVAGTSASVDMANVTLIDVTSAAKLTLSGNTQANVVVEKAGATIDVAKTAAVAIDVKGNDVKITGDGSKTVVKTDLTSLVKAVQDAQAKFAAYDKVFLDTAKTAVDKATAKLEAVKAQATVTKTSADSIYTAAVAVAGTDATLLQKAAQAKLTAYADADKAVDQATKDLTTAQNTATTVVSGGGAGGGSGSNTTTYTILSVISIADINVDYGTTVDAVKAKLPSSIGVTMTNNVQKTADITWDTSAYNGNTAGTYVLNGTLSGDGIVNINNLTASVKVIVGAAPRSELQKYIDDEVISKLGTIDLLIKNKVGNSAGITADQYRNITVTVPQSKKDVKLNTIFSSLSGKKGSMSVGYLLGQVGISNTSELSGAINNWSTIESQIANRLKAKGYTDASDELVNNGLINFLLNQSPNSLNELKNKLTPSDGVYNNIPEIKVKNQVLKSVQVSVGSGSPIFTYTSNGSNGNVKIEDVKAALSSIAPSTAIGDVTIGNLDNVTITFAFDSNESYSVKLVVAK